MTSLLQEQRKAEIEARVLASVAESPKNLHEIRRFVQEQSGFAQVMPSLLAEVVNRLRHRKRLVMVFDGMRSIADYVLPKDPMEPIDCMRKRLEPNPERERKIIERLDWSRFFRIPRREDLLPMVKTSTDYDMQADCAQY